MRPAVTLTIRRRSSGYKVASLAVDSLDHAWTIANILMRSPEYARCYIIAIGWDGAEIFTVGITQAAVVFQNPNYAPALTPVTAYSSPTNTQDAYAVEVVDEETSRYGLRLPPRRA